MPDDDTEDPVSKTLRTLQQGASDVGQGLSDAASSAGTALGSAAQTASSYLPDWSPQPAPEPPRPTPVSGWEAQQPIEGSSAVDQAQSALGTVNAGLGAFTGAVLPSRERRMAAQEALRSSARELPLPTPEQALAPIDVALGNQPGMALQAAQDVSGVLGPETGLPVAAARAVEAPVQRAVGALGEAAGGAVEGVSGALSRNAERVASADARMAEQGGTALAGTLGAVPEGFGAAAARGTVHDAPAGAPTWSLPSGVTELRTPISAGLSSGYSPDDIQAFYLQRRWRPEWDADPSLVPPTREGFPPYTRERALQQASREFEADLAKEPNAVRVMIRDARMAAEGGTTLPGTLGVITDNPLEASRATRTRIVPPEVADTLNFPIRPPTDPTHIRAIEAAGGTVDERGTTLNVIRMSDPEAAGGVATRGMPFYTAGPPGAPSEYARTGTVGPGGVGGQQRIEGPTRFRNPLIISDAPGEAAGFDDAMRQMTDSRLTAAQQAFDQATADWEAAMRSGAPNLKEVTDTAFAQRQQAYDRLAEARASTPAVPTAQVVEAGIRQAKQAGPAGSTARAQALKDLVSRYGGDPELIDPLIGLRGADMGESVYAVKENIVSGNARRAGHDGVITVSPHPADAGEIAAHPAVQEAGSALDAARQGYDQASGAYNDARNAHLGPYAQQPGEDFTRYWNRTLDFPPEFEPVRRAASADPEVRRLQDLMQDRYQAMLDAEHAHQAATEQARLELGGGRITELADPREARNPTPGAPNPAIAEAKSRLNEARARKTDALAARRDAAELGDLEAERLALNDVSRWQDVQAQATKDLAEALKSPTATPPGYTLRPDIPRRGGETTASATAGTLPAAGAAPDRLAAVNRVLGQGVASTFSGGTGAAVAAVTDPGSPQGEDESDADYAIRRTREVGQRMGTGFAVGALGPLAAQRGARGLARLAGAGEARGAEGALGAFGVAPGAGGAPQPGPGFFAQFPGAQKAIAAAQARAANMAARGVQPLGPLEWGRKLAGEVGYSSMIGPTTFTASMLGGPIEAAWNVPKRVLGAALPKGVGGRAAPAEGLTIAQGALRGLGEVGSDIVDALRGQGGNIADALAGRGRYAAVPGHEPLSAQTINPIGHAVTTGLEAGGRFWSGLPDAIYGTIGRRVGEHQAAAEAATGAGLSGQAWKQHVDALLADVENVKGGAAPAMSGTQAVLDAGEQAGKRSTYQDALGTYGDAAKKWASIPLIPDGKGGTKPVPVVGNMISPFFNTPWNMELRLAEKTPGLGAMLNTQKGFDKAYDQVVGTALVAGMGTYAASGHITGSGPDDPEKKRMLMATGWRPYSTNISGYYVPNRVLGEFGPLLNAVGDAHDAMAYSKDQSPAGIAGNFGARFGQQLQQRVWLQGLSELIKALDAGGQAGAGAGLERYAAGLATRMVPYAATARSVLTSEDPWARTTDRGPGTTPLGRIGQQVQSGLGLGQGIQAAGIAPLPIQQDVLGRPQANPQRGGRAAFVKVGESAPDPTIQAFQTAGVDIGAPPTDITMGSVPSVPLTPAERRRWEQARGEYLLEATPSYTNNPDFQALPPGQQAPYLQRLLPKASAHAAQVVQAEMDAQDRQRRMTEAARKKAS